LLLKFSTEVFSSVIVFFRAKISLWFLFIT
jgi:hypothetical protein